MAGHLQLEYRTAKLDAEVDCLVVDAKVFIVQKVEIIRNHVVNFKKHNIHPTENWYTDTAGSPECKNKTNQYREIRIQKVSLFNSNLGPYF